MKHNYTIMMFVLFFTGLFVLMNLYVTIPLITVFSTTFHVSLNEASLFGSVFSLGFAIGCLIYGVLSDKFGRKRLIVIGLIFLTLFSFLIGLANNFTLLITFRFLQGFAASSFSAVALAYTTEAFPNTKKTTALGLISTSFLIAAIVGQLMASHMTELFGWQSVFTTSGSLLLIALLLVLFFIPKIPISKPDASIWSNVKLFPTVLKMPLLIPCFIQAFFLLFAFVTMYILLYSKLSAEPFNLSSKSLFIVRSIGIIAILFGPFSGRIAQKITTIRLLQCAWFINLLSSLCMAFSMNAITLTFFSVLFVLGTLLIVPSVINLVGTFSDIHRGVALSLYTFILFLGSSFAPLFASSLNRLTQTIWPFISLGCVLLIPLIATFYLSMMMKKHADAHNIV